MMKKNFSTKPIVVGIDIRDLKIAKTGTKTYLEEICKEFKKGKSGFQFYFFDSPLPVYNGKNKVLKLVEHLRFFLWKQVMLPFLAAVNSCDVVFCTDFFVPYVNINFKTIPVFHDAFFWEYPEHYNKHWLKIFHHLGVNAAKKSPYVIAPTLYAKNRIAHFSTLIPEKIIVISEAPKTLPQNEVLSTGLIRLKTKKFFLHIGTFEKRKNISSLVEALHKLHRQGYTDYSLVLCGQFSPKNDMDGGVDILNAIKKYNLGDYVIMPGYVNDHDLSWYYRNAELYLFPSVNEGFGLPILEAFQHQLPVIVANNTCLPEVGGNAVLTFDPFHVDELVEKIILIIADAQLRATLIENGNNRLAKFSWENTANELLAVFKATQKHYTES
ncbi:glycosyltransferase family 4 protein [Pedobacter agri]|uniref:glycosyltransferase family 4 protein n=1 Tax=Pedobacter agri TaxID=454586 RepID=UPI002787B9C1|nr:glycosyltransferase family 1 protein [Pedobacter agri]MDQ1141145.1 glycosyltransferase involved in cell wall biosynthesis [Pedobacter agri]